MNLILCICYPSVPRPFCCNLVSFSCPVLFVVPPAIVSYPLAVLLCSLFLLLQLSCSVPCSYCYSLLSCSCHVLFLSPPALVWYPITACSVPCSSCSSLVPYRGLFCFLFLLLQFGTLQLPVLFLVPPAIVWYPIAACSVSCSSCSSLVPYSCLFFSLFLLLQFGTLLYSGLFCSLFLLLQFGILQLPVMFLVPPAMAVLVSIPPPFPIFHSSWNDDLMGRKCSSPQFLVRQGVSDNTARAGSRHPALILFSTQCFFT